MNDNFISIVQQLGTLRPGDSLVWDGERPVVSNVSFWDRVGRAIRRLGCNAADEAPFCITQATLQAVSRFFHENGHLLPPRCSEDLRCFKLYIANPEWQCPIVGQTIKKINESLVRFHRPQQLPADLLQQIAAYDETGNTFRAMRQVSVSCHNALHPRSLSRGQFFVQATQGSRRHIAQLVHFLAHLRGNRGSEELLAKFLNEATPRAQQLFWHYASLNGFTGPIQATLFFCKERVQKLAFSPNPSRVLQFDNLQQLSMMLGSDVPDCKPEQLRQLTVRSSSPMLSDVQFDLMIQLAVNLRELTIQNLDIYFSRILVLSEHLRSLEKLTITHPMQKSDIQELSRFHALTELSLCLHTSSSAEICDLVNKLPQLTRLSILGKRAYRPVGIMFHVGFGAPRLALSVQHAIEILQRVPQLVAIEIGQDEISVEEAVRLLQALMAAPHLEHLALSFRGPGLATLWPNVCELPSLKSLRFFTDDDLPNTIPQTIQSHLSSLSVSAFSVSRATQVAAKLPNLVHLVLQGNLHAGDIDQLVKCQKLQRLEIKRGVLLNQLLDIDQVTLNNEGLAKLATMSTLGEIHLGLPNRVTPEFALRLLRLRRYPHIHSISGFTDAQLGEIDPQYGLTNGERFALSELKELQS